LDFRWKICDGRESATQDEKYKIAKLCQDAIFRRAFKEFTGPSPSKYMMELKLNEALISLDIGISELEKTLADSPYTPQY